MINIDVILMNKNGGCPQISKLGQNDDQLEEFWGCPEVSAYFTKHQEVCGLPQIDMDHTDFEIEIINLLGMFTYPIFQVWDYPVEFAG